MAKRRTIHVLKNNQVNNGALPTSGVQMGEPLVNLYNGILFFSGVTGGNYVQSNSNPGYFEAGSNLYNLELRNQITKYQNISGVGLEGKFLSGTTTGFVLADIATIAGSVDSYTTGATWTPNTLTISLNQSKPSVPVTINSFVGLNLFGTTNATNLVVTGTSYYNQTVVASNPYEVANVGFVTAYTQTSEVYVTGGTNTAATNGTSVASIGLLYNQKITPGTYTLPYTDSFTTGTTLNGSNILSFTRNDGVSYSVDLNGLAPTGTTSLDKYVTGFTYNNANILTIGRNQGLPDLTVNISTLGTITVNGNATVTGVTTTGNLVSNNPIGTVATIGQGGLQIGSGGSTNTPGIGNLIIHGNLTVFGTGTTIATSELYVEDPQITLNYNPSGNTAPTSIAAGLRIQDGNGLTTGNTDVYLTIAQMNTFTGGAVTEYTGPNGYSNRAFLTQLNDIVIRNTNLNNGAPDGFRVLAEFDILDGGTY